MANCLIVTAKAGKIAEEITRLAEFPIPMKVCISAEQALDEYTNESILFGDPDTIAEILPEMPTVKWVQSTWAGVKPLLTLDRQDYVLTGMKGVFGAQISEYVFGYLLAHELKVLRRKQEQRDHHWFNETSGSLGGKCLGIMGTGSIGRHVARTARIFGVKATGLSRLGASAPDFEKVMPVEQLHQFLGETDYLVSALPQTNETENLLDATALAKLPAHAYFINVGRSNVVDDEALVKALRNQELAGAALDVFDEEPVPQDSALWDAPNLTITAHIAAVSHASLIVPVFVENYRRFVAAERLNYVVDLTAGY